MGRTAIRFQDARNIDYAVFAIAFRMSVSWVRDVYFFTQVLSDLPPP